MFPFRRKEEISISFPYRAKDLVEESCIKTRPDLSKNRKVKLYSIAQSWLKFTSGLLLLKTRHDYLQSQPVHTG